MASIESLLNPLPDLGITRRSSIIPSRPLVSSASRHKKQKAAKDAPVFLRGKIRGELRYPPCEERDETLAKHHRDFRIHPMGEIAEFPRHIPYNSEKKSFQEKTGRESFEVFQYTFTIPGEDKEWTVMWDYNIGLVRTTHLFKCNDYSKTTPAKMLNANPGLRDICHSITGGALAAQGYWMPFDAAKAVAATFCWNIRFALTPVFGLDFPEMCVHPQDRGRFGRMIIDAAIVQKATETANHYRMLELRSLPGSISVHMSRTTPTPYPSPDGDSDSTRAGTPVDFSRARNGPMAKRRRAFGTSRDFKAEYCVSPTSPYRSAFTPVNTPRSLVAARSSTVPAPREVLASLSRISMDSDEDYATETDSTRYSELSKSSPPESDSADLESKEDSDSDTDIVSDGEKCHGGPSFRAEDTSAAVETNKRLGFGPRKESTTVLFAKEVKAAHALLSLHLQELAPGNEKQRPRSQRFDEPAPPSVLGRKRRRVSI